MNSTVVNSSFDLPPIKVLIADDDSPTRMLLRAAIAQWKYEVVEASDGEEAWQILKGIDAPHLVILDWMMPKIDGITLCSRIKQELSFHPYIILLTQLTGTTNIVKALDAGANEFLSKPFNMAELRSRLSVGARVIRYENQLAENNKRLLTYLNQLGKMDELAQILSVNINATLECLLKGSLQASSEKVQTLQKVVETLAQIIKDCQRSLAIQEKPL